ncbi:MAG TPA: protein kinase [Polyangiaceae bacterium]|nr:protein kinase [Polyangiaceae bacterium]
MESPNSPQESQLTKLVDEFLRDADDTRRLPAIGDVVGGVYRILGELGRGAMGVVLEAFDLQLHRKVAIKFVNSASFDGDSRQHFIREARAMALVNHPNVLAIHSFGEHGDVPYFVMELVDGQTVDSWLSHRNGQADLDEALAILNDVCQGVSAIHAAGTVHCDLKPSNVLLDNQLRVRVADLGLAAPYVDGNVTKVIAGTPEYMAPELAFDSDLPASVASDIYALGCMAYEMLTGSLPFDGRSALAIMVRHATEQPELPSQRRPGLPIAFDDVLSKALQKRPQDRFASADLFRRALNQARACSVEPVRILVAEDDPDFRDLLALKLGMEFPDAEIVCVGNGGDLVRAFDEKPASVVMIDLQMPILDGVEVTALLRSRPDAQSVPIIVMTASGGPQEWKLLSSLGADRFLVKPVNLNDVVTTLRSAVRERSSSPPNAPSPSPVPTPTPAR